MIKVHNLMALSQSKYRINWTEKRIKFGIKKTHILSEMQP